MKTMQLTGLFVLVSMSVACAAESAPSNGRQGEQTSPISGGASAPVQTDSGAAPAPGCTPLPASSGGANPASVYCAALGYKLDGEACAFPDGTTCEAWSFYRGECGQAHSFCNTHGGSVATKTEDMGGWTAVYALCTLPGGKQCHEDAFAQSCSCE